MSRFNNKTAGIKTTNLAGGSAYKLSDKEELATLVTTTYLKDTFYRSEDDTVKRIKELVEKVDPIFAAKAALYARHVAGMRSVSHYIGALLAPKASGTEWARKFYTNLPRIPQDITETLGAFNALNGGKLSHAMKHGFAKAFTKFDLYQLRKYHLSNKEISLIDAINLTHANSTAIREFKKLLNESGTKGLSTAKEAVVSRAMKGVDKENRSEVASQTLDNLVESGNDNGIGYLALIRSIRQYSKSTGNIDAFCERITNQEAIMKSKVFPYQILTAYIVAVEESLDKKILNALVRAMELSMPNAKPLEGKTLIIVDVSGSMGGGGWGEKDRVSTATKAGLFAGALYKANPNADIVMVDTALHVPNFNSSDSISTIATNIAKFGGGGTDLSLPLRNAIEKKAFYDRMIFLTDVESWADRGYGVNYYEKYKREISPAVKVFNVQFEGYGTSQFNPNDKSVYTFAGYNDKVMEMITNAKTNQALVEEIEAIKL